MSSKAKQAKAEASPARETEEGKPTSAAPTHRLRSFTLKKGKAGRMGGGVAFPTRQLLPQRRGFSAFMSASSNSTLGFIRLLKL